MSALNFLPYTTPDRGYMGDPRRGASLGRSSSLNLSTTEKLHLRRVPLIDGGYDQGGVYWGGPVFWSEVVARQGAAWLYCAWTEDGRAAYVRAWTREEAKAKFPNARFYR